MALPPPPINDKPGSFTWLEWYRQLRNYVSTSGSVPWYILNFSGSNITDITQRSHENLQTLQGGSAGEHYHLTANQLTDLTDGNDSTAHYHATDRNRTNHTGTQSAATITGLATVATTGAYSDLSGTPTGLSVTITTAKLTALGTDGSMTFVNGILTAQTPAT
jgi:hypothetical protein